MSRSTALTACAAGVVVAAGPPFAAPPAAPGDEGRRLRRELAP